MALNRTAKIWLIVLSIPVGLLIAAIVFAKLYFTSDRLKALIVPQIEQSTHRTVAVNDISFTIFPSLGVSIDGLTISNPKNRGFEGEQFISLDHLALDVKILPLISNKIEINQIVLDHPTIHLEVTKDGVKNFSGNEPEARNNAGTSRERGQAGALLLSDLEIKDGELTYTDRKFDSRIAMSGLNATLKAATKPGENAFHLDENASIDKCSYGTLSSWYLSGQPVTARGSIDYQFDTDVLRFGNIAIKVKELPITLSGSISKLQQVSNQMDVRLVSNGVQMTQLLSLVPPEMLKKTAGVSGSGEIGFSVLTKGESSETMNPSTSGSFTVSNGSIQYASLPKSIGDLNLSGTFEKPAGPVGSKGSGSFTIDKMSARIGTNTITGKMGMSNFDDPFVTMSLNGSVNLDEVKEFYPLEQGTEVHGLMKSAVALEGRPKTPQSMKANGSIDFHDVAIKSAASKAPLRNLNGSITFNNQVVQSKQLAMNVGESDLNLSFTLKNYMGMVMEDAAKSAGRPAATVTLVSKQLRTADLMPESPSGPSTPQEHKKSEAPAGILPAIDIDANVAIDKLVTDKFTFTNARGSTSIANGKITLKKFTTQAFQGDIQTQGTLDLSQQNKRPFDLDLNINNVESSDLLPSFTSFGKYLSGKMSMNTKLKGDLNDTLGLNTQSLLGNGTVHMQDGKLTGLPLMQKLADYTSLDNLRQLAFKDWANAFSIQDGRLAVKDLKVNAGTTGLLVNGSQGLDGSMDYNLTVKLPDDVSGRLKLPGIGDQLIGLLKDNDGRINLNFLVTGMTNEPVLKLNMSPEDLVKKAAEQKGNEGKQKLEDELKKKAEEGLKKLFKKP
jgi:uncharacterized protein involved in outer membrane biogenesis